MTKEELVTILNTLCNNVREWSAPSGVRPCVVWHAYGRHDVIGDDRNFTLTRRVQLDILMVSELDTLADSICEALADASQPYEFVDEFYDDEYGALRVILQLEVL